MKKFLLYCLCLYFAVFGCKKSNKDINKKISLTKKGNFYQGKSLLVSIKYTNNTKKAVKVYWPQNSEEIRTWLHKLRKVHLVKEQGKVIPRRQLPAKKIYLAPIKEKTIHTGKSLSFAADLRRVFDFPVAEAGSYQLSILGAKFSFSILSRLNHVFSCVVPAGKSPYAPEVEYLIVTNKNNGKKRFSLLARPKNGSFEELYHDFKFTPTGIWGFYIENTPGAVVGTIAILASKKAIYILNPGQSYYGKMRRSGSRYKQIKSFPVANVTQMHNFIYRANSTQKRTDMSILATSNGKSKKLYFCLHQKRIQILNKNNFGK